MVSSGVMRRFSIEVQGGLGTDPQLDGAPRLRGALALQVALTPLASDWRLVQRCWSLATIKTN